MAPEPPFPHGLLDNQSDPFSLFITTNSNLESETWCSRTHPVNAIHCHFACSTMLWEGEQVMVVVSLSRVCPHFPSSSVVALDLDFASVFASV